MHGTAHRVLLISAVYAGQGQRYFVQGQVENALACFSYGHGWLDAAVQAGIFSITKDRNLFTV
jgi:hypothetical protein